MPDNEKKMSRKSELIISLSAFLISIATFCVLAYQTTLWREQNQLILKQQYASVLPYLQIGYTTNNLKDFSLIVVNHGVGPAFIKSISVHYKGKTYVGDAQQFAENVINADGDKIKGYSYSRIPPGCVIPAGKSVNLLDINDDVKTTKILLDLFFDNTAELDIVYKSVYDEEWRAKGMANPPVKLVSK